MLLNHRFSVVRHVVRRSLSVRSVSGEVAVKQDISTPPNPQPKLQLPVADWAHANPATSRGFGLSSHKQEIVQESEGGRNGSNLTMRDMSETEVKRWLKNFTLPVDVSQMSKEEKKKTEKLYARQLRLESNVQNLAFDKHHQTLKNVQKLGKGSETSSSKQLLRKWLQPTIDIITSEQKKIALNVRGEDRNIYGPMLALLRPEIIAVISINTTFNFTLAEPKGAKFTKLAMSIGKCMEEEIISIKENETLRYTKSANNKPQLNHYLMNRINLFADHHKLIEKMTLAYETVGQWDRKLRVKLGSAILEMILQSCTVDVPLNDDNEMLNLPAFEHSYLVMKKRRHGIIRCCPVVYNKILDKDGGNSNVLPYTARCLPMLVPPQPWVNVGKGGYLKLQTKIMRHRDSAWQIDCAKRGKLDDLFETLNRMSSVPWVINNDVYPVIKQIWEEGGAFGDLPSQEDFPMPEPLTEAEEQIPEIKKKYYQLCNKIQRRNRELHSLRCDTIYKLQVAEEFRKEEEIYYPYNMDFRGRVYPIPPNLNHLGSDLCRSLLIFKEEKPLGPNGFHWMKVHLANLCGVDKIAFDDRARFVEENMSHVLASAEDPINYDWWKKADYPFLALSSCFEIAKAVKFVQTTNPLTGKLNCIEDYKTRIPIHQDGSCNGLQHYAALGRDESGGNQVNLVSSEKPQDVYSGVADKVLKKMQKDADSVLPDPDSPGMTPKKYQELVRNKKSAQLLVGRITRKVVKQTVMTSVYGVTYIGARKQIQARLEEILIVNEDHAKVNKELDNDIYSAACYAADITMASMTDLFTSARSIMDWLALCAKKVSNEGQPMSWVTPLGLPVVQPYRRPGSHQVKTRVQNVILSSSESLPVSTGKQKSAFPPNYVHSLDSTHMLMTAKVCFDEGIDFAAVHDSYWTHPCHVDNMNQNLREQFVRLYQQPLLEDLLEQLEMRFPHRSFPPIPKLGSLELTDVLTSPYFFN